MHELQHLPRHRPRQKAEAQKAIVMNGVNLLRKRTENYNLSRDELQRVIDQWIFNERNRLILSDRLFNGTTYERLAEKYGLSTQQVKTIVYKAMDRLEKHL